MKKRQKMIMSLMATAVMGGAFVTDYASADEKEKAADVHITAPADDQHDCTTDALSPEQATETTETVETAEFIEPVETTDDVKAIDELSEEDVTVETTSSEENQETDITQETITEPSEETVPLEGAEVPEDEQNAVQAAAGSNKMDVVDEEIRSEEQTADSVDQKETVEPDQTTVKRRDTDDKPKTKQAEVKHAPVTTETAESAETVETPEMPADVTDASVATDIPQSTDDNATLLPQDEDISDQTQDDAVLTDETVTDETSVTETVTDEQIITPPTDFIVTEESAASDVLDDIPSSEDVSIEVQPEDVTVEPVVPHEGFPDDIPMTDETPVIELPDDPTIELPRKPIASLHGSSQPDVTPPSVEQVESMGTSRYVSYAGVTTEPKQPDDPNISVMDMQSVQPAQVMPTLPDTGYEWQKPVLPVAMIVFSAAALMLSAKRKRSNQ